MSSWHNDWCRESIYPGNIAELADKMGAGVISVSASSWRAVISPHIIQPVQMTLLISMQPIWGFTISVTSRCECDIVPGVHAVWHSDNTISCWLFTPLTMSNFSETVHSITRLGLVWYFPDMSGWTSRPIFSGEVRFFPDIDRGTSGGDFENYDEPKTQVFRCF